MSHKRASMADSDTFETELLLRAASSQQSTASDKHVVINSPNIIDSGIGAEFLSCSMTKSASLWKALSCHSEVLDTPEMSASLTSQLTPRGPGSPRQTKPPRSRSLSTNIRCNAARGVDTDVSGRYELTSAPPIGTCWLYSDAESVDSTTSADEWGNIFSAFTPFWLPYCLQVPKVIRLNQIGLNPDGLFLSASLLRQSFFPINFRDFLIKKPRNSIRKIQRQCEKQLTS